MNITPSPIKEVLLNETGLLNQVWIQFFSSIGTGLKGEWSKSEYKIEINNTPTDLIPDRTVLAQKGSTIALSIHFNGSTTFNNANFNIKGSNNKDLNFEDSYLNIYQDGGTLLGGAFVSGNTISIPNVSSVGHCNISGTLILKETKNNIGGN